MCALNQALYSLLGLNGRSAGDQCGGEEYKYVYAYYHALSRARSIRSECALITKPYKLLLEVDELCRRSIWSHGVYAPYRGRNISSVRVRITESYRLLELICVCGGSKVAINASASPLVTATSALLAFLQSHLKGLFVSSSTSLKYSCRWSLAPLD